MTRNLSNQFIPPVLGLQDKFDNFAHGAGAALQLSNIMRRIFRVLRCVSNSHRQTNQSHDADVAEVIADEAAFINRNMCVCDDFFERDYFVLRILVDVGYLQLVRSPFHSAGGAARHDSALEPRAMPNGNSLSITSMK